MMKTFFSIVGMLVAAFACAALFIYLVFKTLDFVYTANSVIDREFKIQSTDWCTKNDCEYVAVDVKTGEIERVRTPKRFATGQIIHIATYRTRFNDNIQTTIGELPLSEGGVFRDMWKP